MLLRSAKNAARASVDNAARWFGPHKASSGEPRLWILMYHRILPKSDPRYALEEPGMIVEPDTFAMHLELLQQHFDILPLKEWLSRRLNGQALPSKSCAITFDDGWHDNYQYAFPLLQKFQLPATLFAVSDMIGTRDSFWPNQVASLLEQPIDSLREIAWLAPHLPDAAPHDKRELSAQVIQSLKRFPDDQIHAWLAESTDSTPGRSLMNWDELREMANSGLVDVGSHTCHHYRLREDLSADVLQREVANSRHKLRSELDQEVPLFCYPNGDVCELARQTVAEHYQAAVTTERGINIASKLKPYELLRLGIHEDRCDSPARFLSRLANWY